MKIKPLHVACGLTALMLATSIAATFWLNRRAAAIWDEVDFDIRY